eukprot:m.410128 g.410128  ORF g.410128 m.410128 type:complete len:906 (+) comp20157_c3_seq3:1801-4518(+)
MSCRVVLVGLLLGVCKVGRTQADTVVLAGFGAQAGATNGSSSARTEATLPLSACTAAVSQHVVVKVSPQLLQLDHDAVRRAHAAVTMLLAPETCSRLLPGAATKGASHVFTLVFEVGYLRPESILPAQCGDSIVSTAQTAAINNEGFVGFVNHTDATVTVRTTAAAGVLLAAGRLVREMDLQYATAQLPATFCVAQSPAAPTRSHQMGFYFGSRQSDFEQFVRELAVFGTNQIEFAHFGWATGVLKASRVASAVGVEAEASAATAATCSGSNTTELLAWVEYLDTIGLNVSLWWPMNLYTVDNGTKMDTLFADMKRLDSLFIPGGDGGLVLPPAEMLGVVAKMAGILRRHHPGATVWVSGQEYSQANLTALMALAGDREHKGFLSGLVYGPHERVPLAVFDAMAPPTLPVRLYPDLCHTKSAQFEVARWDHALAFTHGRLAVAPRPAAFAGIVNQRLNATFRAHQAHAGFGAYSEGLSDDLNKCVWSGLYSDPDIDLRDLIGHYAKLYLVSSSCCSGRSSNAGAPDHGQSTTSRGHNQLQRDTHNKNLVDLAVDALYSLEQNWHGPVADNMAVSQSLALFSTLVQEGGTDPKHANWRFQAYLYRAYYDAFVQARAVAERAVLSTAVGMLSLPSSESVQDAARLLEAGPVLDTRAALLLNQTRYLAQLVQDTLGGGVLQCQAPDLGIDTVNAPISDMPWLLDRLHKTQKLKSETEQQDAVLALLNWTSAGVGGFYDNLGSVNADDHPHLDPGQGVATDASYYFTPLMAMELDKQRPQRMAWQTFAQAFYDNHIRLYYDGLAAHTRYKVTVVYIPGSSSVKMVASGTIEVHGFFQPEHPPKPYTFDIPPAAVFDGRLELELSQPKGLGGNGACCQVAEVWIHRHDTVLGVEVVRSLLGPVSPHSHPQ